MNVWYTPERIALHHEIDERRMARHERRAARIARQRCQEHVLAAVKTAFECLFGAAFAMALLFAVALWAAM